MSHMMGWPEWSCWSCGSPVTPQVYDGWGIVIYRCYACDVTYRKDTTVPRDIFTDPDAIRREGYIDHPAMHMPSPA